MGLIYDADKDYNNAFIAYRNAYNIYKNNYTKNFNTSAPNQLKKDILRTAFLTGLNQELEFYKAEFKMNYTHSTKDGGDLIFLWLNGLGPVKAEWSINLTSAGGGNFITLANEGENLSFPLYIGDLSRSNKSALSNLSMMRVAFPKYVERAPILHTANIEHAGINYKLEKAEDINSIAFKTLRDRMLREMANSLLRLATKKALEEVARSQDETVGMLLSIVNSVSEKADTRNWQTLPYTINYTRINLPQGNNKISLETIGNYGTRTNDFDVFIKNKETKFLMHHSLDTK